MRNSLLKNNYFINKELKKKNNVYIINKKLNFDF